MVSSLIVWGDERFAVPFESVQDRNLGQNSPLHEDKKDMFLGLRFSRETPYKKQTRFCDYAEKKRTIIRSLRLELIVAENLIVHSW